MLVMAAAGVGLWSTPAAAAACAPGQGVSVVLDHKDVPGGSGKGVVVDCVRDGAGRSARAVFKSAGVSMRDTTRFPGLVCLVDGLPSPNPACVMAPPANAFWGLYWSNGRDGKWIFSSIGVDGLNVPDGGSVAWAWQGAQSLRRLSRRPSSLQEGAMTPTQVQVVAGRWLSPRNQASPSRPELHPA